MIKLKDSILNPNFIKSELNDLEFMSSFIMYDKFGYNTKKLKKTLMKMKKKLKKGKFSDCLTEDDGDKFWEQKKNIDITSSLKKILVIYLLIQIIKFISKNLKNRGI